MNRATLIRATVAALAVLAFGAGAVRVLFVATQSRAAAPAVLNARAAGGATPAGVLARSSTPDAMGPTAIAGLTVSNVTGPVERQSGAGDAWRPVAPGETIALNESLRTGSGGAALLELQDHTTIWIWPESQVAAQRIDAELSRIGIDEGRLDVNVPLRDRRSVEVAAQGGGATATTRGARFSIIVDGAHVATVATHEGEVDVVSGTGRVRVPPGMQTRARPGEEPEVVTPIPSALLLDVDWPSPVLRSRTALLTGRAPAGVLVSVGATRVVVASDGTFRQAVNLSEGDNRVDVTAEDVVGHHVTRRSPTLRVDTHPPAVGAHGRWE